MKVVFTRGARIDLDEIAAWIGRDSPRAAARQVDALIAAGEALGRFPESFPLVGRGAIRKRPVGRYLVFYRATDIVEILHVLHTARDWPDLLDDGA